MRNSDTPLWDKAIIIPVEKEHLDFYWPHVRKYILRALEYGHGELDADEIRSDIETFQRQLWVIKHQDHYIAAVVTQIYSSGRVKIGEITLAAGENHGLWDHFTDVVGHWFKSIGCTAIDIVGRKGWERLYGPRGFKTAYTILRKEL